MKKVIIAIAIGVFAFVGTSINIQANPYGGHGYRTPASTTYVSGYRHGRPVYTEKIFVGYDCHGHPRFSYRQVYAPVRQYRQPCRPAARHYDNGDYHQSYHGRSGSSVSFTFRR